MGASSVVSAGEDKPKGSNAYQLVTGSDVDEDRSHWDALYDTKTYVFGKEPAAFLMKNVEKLPVGRALDIAMGEGRNAVFLAKKGFRVDGVDLSEVALKKARRLAKESRVSINTITADLSHYTIRSETYDLIVNINYLQRSLAPQIKRGLKKGGMLVFESHTVEQLSNTQGQSLRRDYLLERGELRELFKELKILHYAETNDGKDAVASLIAMKP